ncbi:MAG TPA: type III pantothenate kinase, partial [Pirellulaceae bacterium]|nr:type III pantothenate kinase [Pirellulaceae bacterium]
MGGEIGSRETLRQLPGDALIAVDIGNTSVKLAAFSFAALGRAPRGSHAGRAGHEDREDLPEPLVMQEWPTGSGEFALAPDDLPPRPLSWTVSSVHRPACQNLVEWVATHRPRDTVKVLSYRDVPLAIDVDFPERVGLDRLATAVAADFLRSSTRPAIVIDAGTALKVHVVTAERRFVGGAILPGFRMSSAALRGNTDLLPLVPVSTNIEPPPVLGKNTEAAIRSGIYWGAVGAVRELVQRVKLELGVEPQVFITGGDARGLTSLIDHDTRYVPNLCLGGIAL